MPIADTWASRSRRTYPSHSRRQPFVSRPVVSSTSPPSRNGPGSASSLAATQRTSACGSGTWIGTRRSDGSSSRSDRVTTGASLHSDGTMVVHDRHWHREPAGPTVDHYRCPAAIPTRRSPCPTPPPPPNPPHRALEDP